MASARRTIIPEQKIAFAAATLFLAALGFSVPAATLASFAGIALAAAFTALVGIRVIALLAPGIEDASPPLPDAQLPIYTVLIPLYRETAALPGLVRAIEMLDYPAEKLDAKLIIEADDTETLNAARALKLDGRFEIITVPPAAPRTKPKALNYALKFARGQLATIYDAEDWPAPDQLRVAAAALAANPDLACVQAPLECYNGGDNWITRAFALEYAIHFHVWLPALVRLGLPIPLGGTSNHFVISKLRAVGAWDPFNVTEDADLGFRLAARGWRCGMIAPPTLEEATTNRADWTRQRSRWIKGYMQTLLVRARPRETGAGAAGALSLCLTLGAGVLCAFIYAPALFFLCGWLAGAGAGFWPAPPLWSYALPLLAWSIAIASAVPAARRARAPALLRAALWQPIYWLFQTPAAAWALMQLIRRPHFWEKTEHGAADRRPR